MDTEALAKAGQFAFYFLVVVVLVMLAACGGCGFFLGRVL